MKRMMDGSAVFLKYWNIDEEPTLFSYKKQKLPGHNHGISSSIIGGYNVGISIYSGSIKRTSINTFLNYIFSKTFLKDYVMENYIRSGSSYIYQEKDIYQAVKSKFSVDLQFVTYPIHERKNYSVYSKYYRNIIYDFLYDRNNESVTEMLHRLNDLSKVFKISIKDNDDTSTGLIIGILIIVLSVVMLLSLGLYYSFKFQETFVFIDYLSWNSIVIGSVIILNVSFFEFGDITILKCHLKFISLLLGSNMIFIPILWELFNISYEMSTILEWINYKKCIVTCMFVAVEIILVSFGFLQPNTVELVDEDVMNKMFQRCKIEGGFFSYIFQRISLIFIIIIQMIISFIIYISWHSSKLKRERSYLCFIVFTSCVFVILFMIIESIQTNDYILYGVLRISNYMVYSIANYVSLYLFRIIKGCFKKRKEDTEYNDVIGVLINNDRKAKEVDKEYNKRISNKNTRDDVSSLSNMSSTKYRNFIDKIYKYHYKKDVKDITDAKSNINTFGSTNNSSISMSVDRTTNATVTTSLSKNYH